MGAGLNLIFAAAQRPSERMRRVAVVVKHKIGMTVAPEPAGNLLILLGKSSAHGGLGAGTVIPGRSGGNVALMIEALAKFIVGAGNVLAQSVATDGFILREIVRGGAVR